MVYRHCLAGYPPPSLSLSLSRTHARTHARTHTLIYSCFVLGQHGNSTRDELKSWVIEINQLAETEEQLCRSAVRLTISHKSIGQVSQKERKTLQLNFICLNEVMGKVERKLLVTRLWSKQSDGESGE